MPRFTSISNFAPYSPGVYPTGIVGIGGNSYLSGIYAFHVYTSSGTFSVNRTISAQCLCIGGGGGGGGGATGSGGGGGAGGFLTGNITLSGNTTHIVTVGAGGSGGTSASGTKGGNSSVVIATGGNVIVSEGGGFGGGVGANGGNGGSGGGGGVYTSYNSSVWTIHGSGNAGPPRQGYDGGDGYNFNLSYAGAGGGAGGPATSSVTVKDVTYTQAWGGLAMPGLGTNTANVIFNTWSDPLYPGWFASGGSGHNDNGQGEEFTPRIPGGGGNKASPQGTIYTGGGGGGSNVAGGAGGSGVVVIFYRR